MEAGEQTTSGNGNGTDTTASTKWVTCPHCGGVTEQPLPLLPEYVCEDCDKSFAPTETTDHYVEKIEAAADKFADFKVVRTLAGDLTDCMLEIVRTMPKTWAQMPENDQTTRGYAISNACRKAIREAVALLETHERVTIECAFDEVNFKKKGIVLKLGLDYADPETRRALTDAQGKEILIVVADAAQYMGRRAPMAIDKQQPDLPLPDAADAEKQVDVDLDTILANDESEQPVGQIGDLTVEREESEADPFAAGKRSALRGFNETKNPFNLGTADSAEWMRGHAEGEQEREAAAATSGKRRRTRTQANGVENPPS